MELLNLSVVVFFRIFKFELKRQHRTQPYITSLHVSVEHFDSSFVFRVHVQYIQHLNDDRVFQFVIKSRKYF